MAPLFSALPKPWFDIVLVLDTEPPANQSDILWVALACTFLVAVGVMYRRWAQKRRLAATIQQLRFLRSEKPVLLDCRTSESELGPKPGAKASTRPPSPNSLSETPHRL